MTPINDGAFVVAASMLVLGLVIVYASYGLGTTLVAAVGIDTLLRWYGARRN